MSHQAQFDDEVIDELLRLRFIRQDTGLEISLDEDVEKGVDATERDGRAVVFLDGGEIGKVRPLHALLRRLRRRADVKPVHGRHSLQSIQRLDLLRHEDTVEDWSYDKLNETDRISSYIKEQLKNYDFS